MRISLFQQRVLFFSILIGFYALLLVRLDFLQAPMLWDETSYWNTSLLFSDRLIPSLDTLKTYGELNTPLPFVLYGWIEYFTSNGIVLGRLLNLILFAITAFVIGWPSKQPEDSKQPENSNNTLVLSSLLGLVGWFLYPYNYLLIGRLYTDLIACFFVLLGFVCYRQNRHAVSGLLFVLAIASRQYMVAFPAAISVYEFVRTAFNIGTNKNAENSAKNTVEKRSSSMSYWRWIAPLIATLSIFGWIYFFQGLTPQSEAAIAAAPTVQKTATALEPGRAINFLAGVGLYMAVPEFILCWILQRTQLKRQYEKKHLVIAAVLLIYIIIFPPSLIGRNRINLIGEVIPSSAVVIGVYYLFALIGSIRFCKADLMAVMIAFNAVIMMKAFPWDKYTWPIVIIFWYLKSIESPGSTDGYRVLDSSLTEERLGDAIATKRTKRAARMHVIDEKKQSSG